MSHLQGLLREVDQLPPEEIRQLFLYIVEHHLQFQTPLSTPDAHKPQTARVIGLHAHLGAARLREDFFAELPESFWFGDQ